MKSNAIATILLAISFLVGGALIAHPLPDVAPFDADREIQQLDTHAYAFSLATDESISISADKIKKVWMDDASKLEVRHTDDGRVEFHGRKSGKVIVRLHFGDKGQHINTFIVTITD